MRYIDEFRNKKLVLDIVSKIKQLSTKDVSFMEVCGGHTMAIHKCGIPSLLPENISLLSGPGCPVCVTSKSFIDQAIAYSKLDKVIIATFGDLMRVPGSTSTLSLQKAQGSDIRMVYSPLEALEIAKANLSKKIIFLGIGFETTAPTSAAVLKEAKALNLSNFYLYSSHKVMPPAMSALIDEGVKINGYICPGHVSAIAGMKIYEPIVEKYALGCVVSGFEPLDLLQSIYMLVKQQEENSPRLENQYARFVKYEGNLKAQKILTEVFDYRDDWWRGLGVLPKSGLVPNALYFDFDAEKNFTVEVEELKEIKGCRCGDVLKGFIKPTDCFLFGKVFTPSDPQGACMVSSEGACAAYYKYLR